MRIAFLGLPVAALLLLEDGHELVLAGLSGRWRTGERRLRARLGAERVVLDPHHHWAGYLAQLERLQPDLLVSWYFTRRIPMQVVHACKGGGIGVHPSLLPRHRGPDPFFAAIDAGDDVTGVTVHRIEEDYDTGAILAQRRLPIDPSWNAWDLAKKLDRPSLSLLRQTVAALDRGEPIDSVAQEESKATLAPFPTEEDRIVKWKWTAHTIVRRVRALAPNPGAIVSVGEMPLVLLKADTRPCFAVLRPGEAAVIGGVAVVRALDEGVGLLQGEFEGHRWQASDIAHQIASLIAK